LTLFIYGVCAVNKWVSSERIATELYLLLLIHAAFFVLPLVIGFTLYFTILHSFKVLTQEYTFLEERKGKLSIARFAGMLAPYTLLSVFGLGLLLWLQFSEILNASGLLIALILISAVTLPHSVVMEGFYHQKNNRN
jgi:Brp/Blh family beta-carotene 15,15'-monooxygenase